MCRLLWSRVPSTNARNIPFARFLMALDGQGRAMGQTRAESAWAGPAWPWTGRAGRWGRPGPRAHGLALHGPGRAGQGDGLETKKARLLPAGLTLWLRCYRIT